MPIIPKLSNAILPKDSFNVFAETLMQTFATKYTTPENLTPPVFICFKVIHLKNKCHKQTTDNMQTLKRALDEV